MGHLGTGGREVERPRRPSLGLPGHHALPQHRTSTTGLVDAPVPRVPAHMRRDGTTDPAGDPA